jgi:hypothetical protein
MPLDQMITEAILRDKFTPVLNKIASETDAYARRTNAINMAGNVALGIGAGLTAFLVKSTQVAGRLDYIKKSMAAVEGANKAAFDVDYVDKFAQHSMFTYMDLSEAARRLAIQNVSVKGNLQDIADISASSGKPLAQISQLYDALLAGGRVSLALSARGGFSQYGISVREIFAAAGKEYNPKNLQNSMTPQEVADAVHKVLAQSGKAGLNEKMATTTLAGAGGMLQDAVTRFEDAIGGANLPGVIKLLNSTAGAVNYLATSIKGNPLFGDALAFTAGSALLAGGILKAVTAYRQYQAILKTAAAIGKVERAGEAEKAGIAASEGAAVEGAAVKYGGLRMMLARLGGAYTGVAGAETGAAGAMAAGIGVVGLYAIAIAGLAADIYAVVGALYALGDASTKTQQAQAAVVEANKQGYDIKAGAGKVNGFGAKSVMQQYLSALGDQIVGWDTFGKWHPFGSDEMTGSDALVPPGWNKQHHAMAKNGVRAHAIRAAQDAADKRRDAASAAAEQAANGYELDPKLKYQIDHDERRLAYLREARAGQKAINGAVADEIKLFGQAEKLLRAHALQATDAKKKYELLNQADEYHYKAMEAKFGKGKGKAGFDPTIATIVSSAGMSEDEILKRTGIGRHFFRSLGSKSSGLPPDPFKQALSRLRTQKQPVNIQLNLDGKAIQALATAVEVPIIQQLVHMLEGSGNRPLMGSS